MVPKLVSRCCGLRVQVAGVTVHSSLQSFKWTELSGDFFYHCKRTSLRSTGALDRRGQGLVTFAWPHSNCYAFIGICGSRPSSFGSLSRIHSTRMPVSFSVASANMSAVLSIHLGQQHWAHLIMDSLAAQVLHFFVIFARLGTWKSMAALFLCGAADRKRFWTSFSCRARDHFPICSWKEQNAGKWMWKGTHNGSSWSQQLQEVFHFDTNQCASLISSRRSTIFLNFCNETGL